MNPAYVKFLSASIDDRRDAFLGAARRLGTTEQNVEKDFWVCWTLDALFNARRRMAPDCCSKAEHPFPRPMA